MTRFMDTNKITGQEFSNIIETEVGSPLLQGLESGTITQSEVGSHN